MSIIVPVIMSGGVGSRLWPISREIHPKPFIRLKDNFSLIQHTYLRAAKINGVKEILTITSRDFFFYTKDEYNAVSANTVINSFILEPFGRNSTSALALAAHYLLRKYGKKALMLVLPADHVIEKPDVFVASVQAAKTIAETGKLVTFGIKPDAPKTGYGYIEAEGNKVLRFVEKPDLETAQIYLDTGNYLWNSGIFCMQVGSFLKEIKMYCPKISVQCKLCIDTAIESVGENWVQYEIQPDDFVDVDNISVDYAVFEKSENVAVVPSDIGWSDVGSWQEFGKLHPTDKSNNHIKGDTALQDVQNCIIHSDKRLVAGLGVSDLIIADTDDAVLVADRRRVQDVRVLFEQLKSRNHESYKIFPMVHRPWGNYTTLQEGEDYKIKRIEVKPSSSLSLQSHNFRSEHWVVVSGIAKVLNGNKTMELTHNQSTYIPAGHRHRLENIGDELLVLIEVQCGSYLGEDDIIRFDDVYGRVCENVLGNQ